jgi:hypothetical protein
MPVGNTIRPVGRNVVLRQLHLDIPLARRIEHTAKSLAPEHTSVEYPGPEGALSLHIGSIEHDYLTHHVHCVRSPWIFDVEVEMHLLVAGEPDA